MGGSVSENNCREQLLTALAGPKGKIRDVFYKGKRQNSFCLLVDAESDCQEQSLTASAGSKGKIQDVLNQGGSPAT